VYDLVQHTPVRLETVVDLTKLPQRVEGAANAGFPFAVAALTPTESVYVDMRENSVYYNQSTSIRQIAGAEIADPENFGGGWNDGVGSVVRFNVPMGVAVGADGRIAVADTGNRVIRLVDGIDRRYYVGYDLRNFDTYRPGATDYGIAVVGASINWNDTVWDESIAGIAQATLAASPLWQAADLGKPAVVPFTLLGGDTDAKIQYVDQAIADLPVRCVVYLAEFASLQQFGTYSAVIESGPHAGEVNRPLLAAFVAKFAHLRRTLAERNIDFIVVFVPTALEISPAETPISQLLDRYPYNDRADGLARATTVLGEMFADQGMFFSAAPAFARAEAAPHPLPLFGTTDLHPSPAGRALIGQAVAQALEANLDALKGRSRARK
jgi:hypothetical protein